MLGLFSIQALPSPTVLQRSVTAGFGKSASADYNRGFFLHMYQHSSIHCRREGKAVEGGNEDHGSSELVTLDRLVCEDYGTAAGFDFLDYGSTLRK